MGEQFEALSGVVREAVRWTARRYLKEFSQRHPDLEHVALHPSTIEAMQKDIARRNDLKDVLARYKAAVGVGAFDLKANIDPCSSESSELPGHPSDASSASQGVIT
jgi:hypothetical protein